MLLLETPSNEFFPPWKFKILQFHCHTHFCCTCLFAMQTSFLCCFHIISFPLLLPGYQTLRQTILSVVNINSSG